MKEKIVLVGSPNVGKSVIFNALTGSYVTVSNYPGTTVDVSEGIGKFDNKNLLVIDTPGVNSLIPHSQDEEVTTDILLDKSIKTVVQVADSKNLKRTLLLTFQLIETGLPLILDLNMYDEAKEHGIDIDTKKLSQILGIEVVKTVAITKEGISQLKNAILKTTHKEWTKFKIEYNSIIEEAFVKINDELPPFLKNNRAVAVRLLSSEIEEEGIYKFIGEGTLVKIKEIKNSWQNKFSKSLEVIFLEEKTSIVEKIIDEVMNFSKPLGKVFQDSVGKLTLKPITGIFILLFVLFIMYKFVGQFAAGTMVDFFEEEVFGEYINPFFIKIFKEFIHYIFVQDFFVGEYGIITMALTYAFAIIFPIVTAFFLFFGFLEDSGYLPRLSALSDRVFKMIGLNGRAILPMILGLGCGTMAVLTGRILDTRKERILITLLLALCIPCSAQLGVIMGLLGSLSLNGLIIWLVVILTVLVVIGYIASKTIPGERSSFIQEIPPIRIPKINNILIKTFARLKWYIKEAVPLFILGTVILFVFDRIGLLLWIKKLLSPLVVGLLNLPVDTAEAFIIGFLRRDYGTAGLYILSKNGQLNNLQLLISLVVITLFVPCIAQFFVTIKERGLKITLSIAIFVFVIAFFIGGILNLFLSYLVSRGFLVI